MAGGVAQEEVRLVSRRTSSVGGGTARCEETMLELGAKQEKATRRCKAKRRKGLARVDRGGAAHSGCARWLIAWWGRKCNGLRARVSRGGLVGAEEGRRGVVGKRAKGALGSDHYIIYFRNRFFFFGFIVISYY